MKIQIATSPEQSARLEACGVDLSTADMMWKEDMTDIRLQVLNHPWIENLRRLHYSPAWSFAALFNLLPNCLTSPMGTEYRLELSMLRIHTQYEVQWFSGHDRLHPKDNNGKFVRLWDESPIEACVKAIEWLTSKGIKLNNQHDTDSD